MHLVEAINHYATTCPQKVAVRDHTATLLWGDFGNRTDNIARAIQVRGVKAGDRVALILSNNIFHIEAMIGIIKAGCVVTPLSMMLNYKTARILLDDCDPMLIFMANEYAESNPEITDIYGDKIILESETASFTEYQDSSDDIVSEYDREASCSLIYSSGTTGKPKGILHSYAARSDYGDVFAEEYGIEENSRILLTTAAYSNGSWMMILPTLCRGATLIMMQKYSLDKFVNGLMEEKVTHTFLVPTQIKDMFMAHRENEVAQSDLEALVSAGSYLEGGLKRKISQDLHCDFFELYGNTEGVCTILRPDQLGRHIDSVGTAIMGGRVRIIGEDNKALGSCKIGEVVGKNQLMSQGYFQNDQQNEELFWSDDANHTYVRSGDMGEMDEDGFLYIRGRKKEMIISGGFNIFPVDMENELLEHEGVQDAVVMGIPHERWGETPIAAIILKPESMYQENQILAWFNDRVNKHQRLQSLYIVDKFPRNALGKVMKSEMLSILQGAS